MRFGFEEPLRHFGMCDASCGVALPGHRFLAADDERNVLGLFDAGTSGGPIALIDLGCLTGTRNELDLEGSARVGQTVYWITSHGRDDRGDKAPSRRRLFASGLESAGTLRLQGEPYHGLVDDLAEHPAYRRFDLRAASRRPPKEGGLNVEGLAEGPAGALLIGFRSPLIDGRALVAVLENPAAVILGEGASFGQPLLLDLGGRGIRSLERWPEREALIVIAGPAGRPTAGERFAVQVLAEADLRSPPDAERLVPMPEALNPESVLCWPGERDRFLCLSDDGGEERGGRKCKKLDSGDPGKYFRSVWVRCG